MKNLLPEETPDKPVHAKLILVDRKAKPWFQIAGAHIQGEVRVQYPSANKSSSKYQLHGRLVIIMPNMFIIAGTLEYNKIDLHYMLKNNQN